MSSESIVTANAILVYLSSADHEVSLRELSARFGLSWRRILEVLWSINLIDLEGFPDPYSLTLPPAPGDEEPDEPPTGPDSPVGLSAYGSLDVPPLRMGLDEVISLIAIIDCALNVTAPGNSSDALLSLRHKLSEAAAHAGFGGVMWQEPTPLALPGVVESIHGAISAGSWIEVTYRKMDGSTSRMRALPVAVSSDASAVARCWTGEGVRTLRLDRILEASLQSKARRAELTEAKKAVTAEKPWIPQGEKVTLSVAPSGRWIATELPGASSRPNGDLIDVSFPCTSDDFLMSLLVQLGTAVRKIEPAAVRTRLAAQMHSLVEEHA